MTKTAILREDLPKHDFFLVSFTLQEKINNQAFLCIFNFIIG